MNTDVKENKKISSSHENLIITMNKTPKIISMIKTIQPTTLLVGFKLLNQVSHEQLIETGKTLLKNNNCDFVLANDLSSIQKNKHVGNLIDKDTSYQTYKTKEEIAVGIAVSVIGKLVQKNENR
jgi:phosphopantothenate-cysteine ligase